MLDRAFFFSSTYVITGCISVLKLVQMFVGEQQQPGSFMMVCVITSEVGLTIVLRLPSDGDDN